MQENLKQEKRFRTLNIIAICLLLVFFTASLFLAVIAPVFTSNGVASAYDASLPDNGVVNPNLLYNSDFSRNSSNTYSWTSRGNSVLTVDNWYLFNGDLSYVDSMPRLNFDSTLVGNVYSRFYSSNFTLPAGTYTITGCYNYVSGGGTSRLRLNNASGGSFDNYSGSLYVNLDRTAGVHISSFVITLGKSYSVNVDYYSSAPSEGFIADLYWIKIEEGSSFTGFVPDYQNVIKDCQTKYDNLKTNYDDLQMQYDDLLNSMDFSTFNSVDLDSTVPYSSTVAGTPIFSSKATTASFNGTSYGGYYYYRSNVENSGLARSYLCQIDIGSTLPANSDIKLTYDAIFPYQGSFPSDTYVLLGLSNFGLGSDSSNLKNTVVAISSSDFINGSLILNINHDVNYVAFDLGVSNGSGGYDIIDLGMPNKPNNIFQGLFISNFVVSGRGSNFNVAIENANKQGYNKGYQEGKVAGKTIGYQLGVKDQGDYTFMGLLGAVFDAPIQAFKGLLNFEILGVDMTAFVSSLFALAIIVVIIKISLGGK